MTRTPHDALFKAAFSKVRHARGLLRGLLEKDLADKLRWNTLRLESGTTVDDDTLDEQRMDLLFCRTCTCTRACSRPVAVARVRTDAVVAIVTVPRERRAHRCGAELADVAHAVAVAVELGQLKPVRGRRATPKRCLPACGADRRMVAQA